MNNAQFLQLVLGTIETSFENECIRQGVSPEKARNKMNLIKDTKSLIRAIVFGISTRFSDQYVCDLESSINGCVLSVGKFEPENISRRIMKSQIAQQYLFNQRIKLFGDTTYFTSDCVKQMTVKGYTANYTYPKQPQTSAFLKLLRSQWPYLLGAEGRLSRRQNRSNQKLSKTNVGGGNIGCEYMGFTIYAESYTAELPESDVIRIKIIKPNKVGIPANEVELYRSIKGSLTKMFGMMDIVEKVEEYTSGIIICLRQVKFITSPLELTTEPTTAVSSIKERIKTHSGALAKTQKEIRELEFKLEQLQTQVIWIQSDIDVLEKAVKIMEIV